VSADDRQRPDAEPGAVSAGEAVPKPEDPTAAARSRDAAGEAERSRGEARAAEIRSEVAITDARRAEEETARQHEAVEAAREEEQERADAERRAREEAERAQADAAQARERQGTAAGERAATGHPAAATATTGGARVVRAEPVGPPAEPKPTDRPEVQAGIAFVGAFLGARILKRLFD